MEKANERVTISGRPSGIESTIIKKASIKSDSIFLNVLPVQNRSCRSLSSLIIYSSRMININVALIQPMKTKYLAKMVVDFYNGLVSS